MHDFGAKLREARERRGISLRQISTKTRISLAALEALERDDVSRLPGGIFSRAIVRSYALEVGLAPDPTVDEFIERFNQETAPTAASVAAAVPDIEREFEARRVRATRALLLAAIAVPVLLGVAVYLFLRSRT